MRKIKVSSYDTLHFKILIFLKGKKKKRNDFFLDSHIHIFAYISKYILNVLKKKKKRKKKKKKQKEKEANCIFASLFFAKTSI